MNKRAPYTILSLKDYQIWDGFFDLAKLNGGRRSIATLTGNSAERSEAKGEQSLDCHPKPALPEGNSAGRLKQRQGGKDAQR